MTYPQHCLSIGNYTDAPPGLKDAPRPGTLDDATSIERRDVHFHANDGTILAAWLYTPTGNARPCPAITMANGFGGTRWQGVDRFAQIFAEAGFVVLLHDHRNFGTSGGVERGDVDPWRQIADWRAAVTYLQSREEVDEDRVGLWGTGYAGGHALVLGATDRRLAAIVAQTPTISGLNELSHASLDDFGPDCGQLFMEDCRRRLAGEAGLRLAIASSEPDVLAPFRTPEAISFFDHAAPGDIWENETTARSLRASLAYVPSAWISRVNPTPLMLLTATNQDAHDMSQAPAPQASAPVEQVALAGGPFSPFLGEFSKAASCAIRWFSEHLQLTPDRRDNASPPLKVA